LASIEGTADERVREWRRRLARVPAPRLAAGQTYVGDHWRAVLEAYEPAHAYSTRVELWAISAGYGLIRYDKQIKPYSATFAAGDRDSVWRGASDGGRVERLQSWWRQLNHEAAIEELLPRSNGALVIAAGAAYLTAVEADLEGVSTAAVNEETVSVISAGARGNGTLLPVSGKLRGVVGGTDSALNARTLRLLAATAVEHEFRHSEMKRVLKRVTRYAKPTVRQPGLAASDAAIGKEIRTRRRADPGLSRTRALREIRADGIACEQDRFAAIWTSLVVPG
jgi:hypothetical protein